MYSTPRWAFASKPGSKIGRPASMDAWTSNEPTRRSSVQPRGSSINGQSITLVATSPLSSRSSRSRVNLSHSDGLLGSQLQIEFVTTSILGRTPRSERANVVFPVPWPPEIPTPPSEGSIQASFRASFTSSKPSTLVIGMTIPRPMESACAVSTRSSTAAARTCKAAALGGPFFAVAARGSTRLLTMIPAAKTAAVAVRGDAEPRSVISCRERSGFEASLASGNGATPRLNASALRTAMATRRM
mmetsp:Transcript_107400/g.256613  ORF Transcript_107400/g.256613 Transcript_107400/m.256613 type:complete len:244 (+) Transcript_107400:1771-2502(+)